MDTTQIARDLTLAIIDKINPTDPTNRQTMHQSLAEEVGKVYNIILKAVEQESKSKSEIIA